MTIKHRFIRTVASAALLCLCAGTLPPPGRALETQQEPSLEVIHWWTSGGERSAVSVLQKEYDKLGGHRWQDAPAANGTEAFTTIFARIRGGNPPAAAQFNVSRQFDQLIDEGLLLDLTPLAEKQGWRKFIRPKSVLAACERDGRIWCVPVNIHSWQWAWVSTKVFKKVGVPIPSTIDDFLAAAPAIRKAGFTPFALGGEPWQEYGLFGVLLLNIAGKDVHYALFRDKNGAVARSPEVAKVFETFRKLRGFADKRAKGRPWDQATDLVIGNKAGMQIMADWAKAEFVQAGKKQGVDYECLPGPSADPLLQLGGDVFIFPKLADPEKEKEQLKLAGMMLNPKVQVLFNVRKGSLPVRGDVDLKLADECMKKGLEILDRPGSVVENSEIFLSGETVLAIQTMLDKFLWDDRMSVASAQKQFAAILSKAR